MTTVLRNKVKDWKNTHTHTNLDDKIDLLVRENEIEVVIFIMARLLWLCRTRRELQESDFHFYVSEEK